ncbi:hypothetical protein [Vibrio harveyi]|uniref:hypothetical protein n=1 Tax=Vibrio harveyi TaxID=669 RepID=UPI0023808F5C|nr:hypothetical protein [Vibrio harveyi]
MLEIIEKLNLGEWATFVFVVVVLWKFVVKSLVDSWFKSRLDLQKQEVGHALQMQKELVLKQAEFEKIKLERVLPLFEEINAAVSEHKMVFNTYIYYVINKYGSTDKLEEERLKCDERIINAISSLGIYLPDEFRKVICRLRMVVSCCSRDPAETAKVLRSFGAGKSIPPLAINLYEELINCFHSMSAKYLGIANQDKSYQDILSEHNLDSDVKTTHNDVENELAYKFLLLHEYFGSGEQLEAQSKVEELYKNTEQT